MNEIIIEPVLTEKASRIATEGRHYSFKVAKTANKLEIRRAIEERYPDIDVKEVRTMIVRGKRKRPEHQARAAPGPPGRLEKGGRDASLRRDRLLRVRITTFTH